MRFAPLAIAGAFMATPEPLADERGFFARVFCAAEFAEAGLIGNFAQSSISVNANAGTLRGMHYSIGAHAETKLVRCTGGAIFDALVDVRPRSPSYGKSLAFELTATNRIALYLPAGVAHGFQTLRDDSEVLYMIDKPYVASAARGLRWNDAIVGLNWPLDITAIYERDRTYPDFEAARDHG